MIIAAKAAPTSSDWHMIIAAKAAITLFEQYCGSGFSRDYIIRTVLWERLQPRLHYLKSTVGAASAAITLFEKYCGSGFSRNYIIRTVLWERLQPRLHY